MYPREVGQGWILYFDEGRGLPYIANAQKNLTYWTELDLDDGWCIRQDELDDDAVYLNVLTDQVTFDRPPKRHATMVPRQPEVSHQTSTTSSNKTNNLSWFEYFLKATNTEHLKQMLIDEECTTCDTLSLVTEQGLKELGIRMGARVRILQFLEQQNDVDGQVVAPSVGLQRTQPERAQRSRSPRFRTTSTQQRVDIVQNTKCTLDEKVIIQHIIEREKFKSRKNFAQADRIQKLLRDAGFYTNDLSILNNHPDVSSLLVSNDHVARLMGKGCSRLRDMEKKFGTMMFFGGRSSERRTDLGKNLYVMGSHSARQDVLNELLCLFPNLRQNPNKINQQQTMPSDHVQTAQIYVPQLNGGGHSQSQAHTETIGLTCEAAKYLSVQRERIVKFSRAQLDFGPRPFSLDRPNLLQITGNQHELKLAKKCLEIIQGIKSHSSDKNVNYSKLAQDPDISTLQVTDIFVGFVLGKQGQRLRTIDDKFQTFSFFDNDTVREGKKTLYIMGDQNARLNVSRELKDMLAAAAHRNDRAASKNLPPEVGNGRRENDGNGGRRSRSRSVDRMRNRNRSRSRTRKEDLLDGGKERTTNTQNGSIVDQITAYLKGTSNPRRVDTSWGVTINCKNNGTTVKDGCSTIDDLAKCIPQLSRERGKQRLKDYLEMLGFRVEFKMGKSIKEWHCLLPSNTNTFGENGTVFKNTNRDLCLDFQKGKCKRGNECRYRHVMMTQQQRENYYTRPSPENPIHLSQNDTKINDNGSGSSSSNSSNSSNSGNSGGSQDFSSRRRSRSRSNDARRRGRSRSRSFDWMRSKSQYANAERQRQRGRSRSFDERQRQRGRNRSFDARQRQRSRSRSNDAKRNYRSVETIYLRKRELDYLERRNETTANRLEYISGASFDFNTGFNNNTNPESQGSLDLKGSESQIRLAKMIIDVTIAQQKSMRLPKFNFNAFDHHPDVTKLQVKEQSIGFLCGYKGNTLREFERKYDTIIFFDFDSTSNGNKTLYIMGKEASRHNALNECRMTLKAKDEMDFKQNNKLSGRERAKRKAAAKSSKSNESKSCEDYKTNDCLNR